MRHYYTKTLLGILLVALSGLISSSSPAEYRSHRQMQDISEEPLRAFGQEAIWLSGDLAFATGMETSAEGEQRTALNLYLEDWDGAQNHSLDLYISDIEAGPMHKVTEKIDGFLNDFKGVFGFANIDSFGELPYFTKAGEITISRIEGEELRGSLDLVLTNSDGNEIEVRGDFTAIRKITNLKGK